MGSSRSVFNALIAAVVSPERSASMVLTPAARAMPAARCCMSARRCSRFVAMYMIIAIAKAAIAGTVMTIRSLRSIGRSANQRVNRPPLQAMNYSLTLMVSARGQKSAVVDCDQVHVVPTNGAGPQGFGAGPLGFGAGGGV